MLCFLSIRLLVDSRSPVHYRFCRFVYISGIFGLMSYFVPPPVPREEQVPRVEGRPAPILQAVAGQAPEVRERKLWTGGKVNKKVVGWEGSMT